MFSPEFNLEKELFNTSALYSHTSIKTKKFNYLQAG